MKAIVLSYDKYSPLVEHMVFSYQKLWPDHSFRFRIPYQKYPEHLTDKYGAAIEPVPSKKGIKDTVQTLIRDLPDDEWVYWCIDDKYLIDLNLKEVIKVANCIKSISDSTICGVSFSRCRGLMKSENLKAKKRLSTGSHKLVLIERKNYSQIWMHQFLRVKVLRTLFETFPDRNFVAKEMDTYIKQVQLPEDQKLYVTSQNMAVFGESTTRGMLTKNCAVSLEKFGLDVPNMAVSDKEITIGELPKKRRSKLLNFFG